MTKSRFLLLASVFAAVVGVLVACALCWGLWESRTLPYVADVGSLLAHRALAGYTLAMSHLFDLTGPAFAALRLPSILAAVALLIGPALGWILRRRRRHMAATISVAATFAVFLIAAASLALDSKCTPSCCKIGWASASTSSAT